ncbi:MAG: hypothetical protein ACRC1D_05990 [Culicoidibacterales bacterium]
MTKPKIAKKTKTKKKNASNASIRSSPKQRLVYINRDDPRHPFYRERFYTRDPIPPINTEELEQVGDYEDEIEYLIPIVDKETNAVTYEYGVFKNY